MPDKPDTWAWLAGLLQEHWPGLYAGILGFLIGAARIIYDGGRLRRVALEAPFLGLIALAVSNAMPLIGVSPDVAPFFGGLVGFMGLEGTREVASRLLKRRIGDNFENRQ